MNQEQKVINLLLENRVVDNRYCFVNKITYRLGDRIFRLRNKLYQTLKSKYSYDDIKNRVLWADERTDTDKNTHYYIQKGCIKYLKLIKEL